jgi:tetratricopeptide (TPR) repeat protein
MNRKKPDSGATNGLKNNHPWPRLIALGMVCAVVIGIFIWFARPGILESMSYRAQDSYYNLLVQGFRSGQLSVKRDAPPALATLHNPYDPDTNTPYVWDPNDLCYEMSYFKGRLYLYFGATPALVLFGPYNLLTGHYLSATDAVIIFSSSGFLLAAGLLYALWRRYFSETGTWVIGTGIVTVGLCTGILEILSTCDVYETAKSCAFAFTMLALVGLYRALHDLKYEIGWMLVASLAYGLAIASRQTLLFGAVVFLLPAFLAWRHHNSWKRVIALSAAAVGPLAAIGLGLMIYNDLRFGNPLEFGWRYQLTNVNQDAAGQFNLHYLCFNLRFYFLQPAHWNIHFPFFQVILNSPAPAGYVGIGAPYSGLLCNYPVVWLAVAAPLAWKRRPGIPVLRYFVNALFIIFGICALTICLFLIASSRYQFDFLPCLMLLAVIGFLGLDRALVRTALWRRIARGGWCLLLAYTAAFNIFAGIQSHATDCCMLGNINFGTNDIDKAAQYYQEAILYNPESPDAYRGLGCVLIKKGQIDQAMIQIHKALKINPDYADAHLDLASCLFRLGHLDEAIAELQRAVELNPESAAYRKALANLLVQKGQTADAIAQYQKTLDINPGDPDSHHRLGVCFTQLGQFDQAIAEYQKAIAIQPDSVEVYNYLAFAFSQKRMAAQAIDYYEKALKLDSRYIPAEVNLAWLLATWPESSFRNGNQAVILAGDANNATRGADSQILRVLAAAYAEAGRFSEAQSAAQNALTLATAQSNTVLIQQLPKEISLYQNHSPYHTPKN